MEEQNERKIIITAIGAASGDCPEQGNKKYCRYEEISPGGQAGSADGGRESGGERNVRGTGAGRQRGKGHKGK